VSNIVGVRVPPSAPPQKIRFEIARLFALPVFGLVGWLHATEPQFDPS
jgi:hypothetical protein